MEKKLNSLFDFQKFRNNARLSAIIADVESRYGAALSDDDLGFVNAAGEAYVLPEGERPFDHVGAIMEPEGENP